MKYIPRRCHLISQFAVQSLQMLPREFLNVLEFGENVLRTCLSIALLTPNVKMTCHASPHWPVTGAALLSVFRLSTPARAGLPRRPRPPTCRPTFTLPILNTSVNKNDCGRHTGPVLHHGQVFFPNSDTLIGQGNTTTKQNNNNVIPKAQHRFCTMV